MQADGDATPLCANRLSTLATHYMSNGFVHGLYGSSRTRPTRSGRATRRRRFPERRARAAWLDLVDDPREVPRFEEQRVILLCGQIVARVFHRDVAGRLTQMLPKGRRLADLASARHQHHFALFEHTADRWLYFAFYIHEMASLPRGHVLTLRQFGQIWELCSQILLPLNHRKFKIHAISCHLVAPLSGSSL